MRKIILITLMMFSFLNNYSQIKFNLAEQYLKELIAIQSLIAENRDEDLVIFLLKNQWLELDGKNQYTKIDINNNLDNNIIPIFTINFNSSDTYYNRYIVIQFIKKITNSVNNETIYEELLSVDEVNLITSILKESCKIGLIYPMFKDLYDYDSDGKIITEKLSRYKIKVYNKEKPKDFTYYNCSNFMNLELLNKPNSDGFFGPGNMQYTELQYLKMPSKKSEGKYICGLILKSAKNGVEVNIVENFDLDFFMGVEKLNDRIWLDK